MKFCKICGSGPIDEHMYHCGRQVCKERWATIFDEITVERKRGSVRGEPL